MFGFSLSSIALFFVVDRINWQWSMGGGVALSGVLIASTATITDAGAWIWLWFLIGVVTGQAFSLVVRASMELADPTQALGGKLALETFIPALMLLAFPILVVAPFGYSGVAYGAGGLVILMALGAMVMPSGAGENPERRETESLPEFRISRDTILAFVGVLSIAVYFGGQLSVWIFAERAANSLGYENDAIGLMLFLGKCGAGCGGLVAAILGERLGRFRPHLFSVLMMTCAQLLLITHVNYFAFVAGAFLFELAWAFIVSYLIATIGLLDASKRLTVFAPAAMALGGSYGPAVAGHLIGTDRYENVFIMGLITAWISFLVFTFLIRQTSTASNT